MINKIKRGFTLIEILVVVVIVGIIMGIIFMIYNNIGSIMLDANRIKNINQEILYTNTYIQSIADKTDFDPSNTGSPDTIILRSSNDDEYIVSKICDSENKCHINLNENGKDYKLTNPETTYISSLQFKTIPSSDRDPNNPKSSSDIPNIYNHGFWVLFEIKGKHNDPDAQAIKLQTFFDIRGY